MIAGLIDVLRVFVDGCRRLMAVWVLVLSLIALCLITSPPAIDDLNTLLSRNFVRQQFIPTFQSDPVSIGRIVPYVRTWPFYLAGWMFLLGGLLEALVHRQLFQIGWFVRSCTRYFFRFARLLFIEVCVKGLLLLLAVTLASSGRGGSISSMRPLYLCLSFLLMGMTTVVFTYATIRAITEDRLSMLGSTIAAARFVKRRIGRWRANAVGSFKLRQLTDPFAFPASEVLRLALRDGETERIPVVKLCLDRNPNAAKPIHTNNLIYPASHRR